MNTMENKACFETLLKNDPYTWLVILNKQDSMQFFSISSTFKFNLMNKSYFKHVRQIIPRKERIVSSMNTNMLRNTDNYELSMVFLRIGNRTSYKTTEFLGWRTPKCGLVSLSSRMLDGCFDRKEREHYGAK